MKHVHPRGQNTTETTHETFTEKLHHTVKTLRKTNKENTITFFMIR